MPRRPKQLALFAAPTLPSKRPGRRPRADRVGFVPHVKRPVHEWRHPVHVTMRTVRLAPNLRSEVVRGVIVRLFAALKARGVRVVQYSIQQTHLHLMVEAQDRVQLSRKMQLLFSRIAIAVNRASGRRGSLFRDRHHRVDLITPTQTRNALVYILFNDRKHDADRGSLRASDLECLDDKSSAPWFDGWDDSARPSAHLSALCRERNPLDHVPLALPRTWLARAGWRRGGGLVRFDEVPHAPL